ncbi:MAG TPA: GNAT family N-acetyltransferase [Polyangiaceae bacterium]|jgi:GNAT superfamily N-acetyltransferase
MTDDWRVEPARAEHEGALLELYARNEIACHCQYWHFAGDKNEWQNRLAHEPDKNAAALTADLQTGRAEGLVALSGALVIGWLKLARAENLPKLYEQRLYRALPCFGGDRSGILAVGCLLIDEAFRRRGVARALIRASVDAARARGARAVEAFPRGQLELADAEAWTGPISAFVQAGFRVVNDFRPYPVMRHDLTPARNPAEPIED